MSNKNFQKVQELCKKIYPKEFSSQFPVPQNKALFSKFLSQNRLISLTPEGQPEYSKYRTALVNAVKLLDTYIGKKQYMLIKTLSSYPHITSDIDVLVKSQKVATKALAQLGDHVTKPILIDINHIISWTNTEEISKKFIWDNTTTYQDADIEVLVPNNLLDTLIRLGHIPFELAEVRLGELLHVFQASAKIDWKVLEKEAQHMQWPHTFAFIKDTFESLHTALYTSTTEEQIQFPYRISYWNLAQAMIEKRAWKKIWGARYLLKDRLGL